MSSVNKYIDTHFIPRLLFDWFCSALVRCWSKNWKWNNGNTI